MQTLLSMPIFYICNWIQIRCISNRVIFYHWSCGIFLSIKDVIMLWLSNMFLCKIVNIYCNIYIALFITTFCHFHISWQNSISIILSLQEVVKSCNIIFNDEWFQRFWFYLPKIYWFEIHFLWYFHNLLHCRAIILLIGNSKQIMWFCNNVRFYLAGPLYWWWFN